MKLDHLVAILLALAALVGTIGASVVPKLFSGPSRGEITLATCSALLTTALLIGTVVAAMNVKLDAAKTGWIIGAALSGLAFAICILGFLRAPTPKTQAPSPLTLPKTPDLAGGAPTPSTSAVELLAREQLADLHARQAREKAEAAAAEKRAEDAAAAQKFIDAANAATATIDRLRVEYINGHDGISPAMLAGTEALPDEWTNKRLKELGVPFVYRGHLNGSWSLDPSTPPKAH